MKLRVEVNGSVVELHLQKNGSDYHYSLRGEQEGSGSASITEISSGVFSVLIGTRSFQVCLAKDGERTEAFVENARHWIVVADARDRRAGTKANAASGPVEVRSQMPGKIIKVLVKLGSSVTVGQGLLVVEAMKMQNEMKAPKEGVVAKIQVSEGATVNAGETLIVIE